MAASPASSPSVPDYIRSLVPYVPGKPIEETQREFGIRRVVKLASNENPLGPSPRAVAAAHRALKDQHRYPDGAAYHLKRTLSQHLGVESTQIVVGNGSDEVIGFLIRTFCVPGDEILTHRGAFIAYRISAQVHGVEAWEAPIDDRLSPDLDAIVKRARETPRAKAVFLANPNNPTGAYLTERDLRAFLKAIAGVRGGSIIVALDYAYWEYVTAKDLPDPIQLQRDFPNVVVLRTFSKVYGLAGMRIGYGVGSREIVASLDKVRMPFNLNDIGMRAAAAAVGDQAFVRRAVKVNRAGFAQWEKALQRWSVPYFASQGNFLLVDTQAGLGLTGKEAFDRLLRRGVILRPIANYGLHHALRISVGTADENRFAIAAWQEEFHPKPVRPRKKKRG